MNLSAQVAKHFRDVYFGGNWTVSSFKEHLADVSWKQAVTRINSFNTIATLVFHTNYFVKVALPVLQGGPLVGKDTESFDHPPINSEEDWQNFLAGIWADAESFATELERLPEEKYDEIFGHEKYGTYYRNVTGIIEHLHYHLGQIVFLKRMVQENEKTASAE